MRSRTFRAAFALSLALSLAFTPLAGATNDGRGFYGSTDDKVVTNAGFILIIFFPLFVFVMSMIQGALDRRKKARLKAHRALMQSAHLRGGW